MADDIRDAPLGKEKPGFKLRDPWIELMNGSIIEADRMLKQQASNSGNYKRSVFLSRSSTFNTTPFTEGCLEADEQHGNDKAKSIPIVPTRAKEGAILVDWYYADDAENPLKNPNPNARYLGFSLGRVKLIIGQLLHINTQAVLVAERALV
ncbi:major facilitator superfamily domain-containing protein [Penicillium waksmanii]|uniref:major facilitator superfamily domain-containing protein n=1 Tax=Penicillium waksmanii TaxID=69791 RepID=UPI0025480EE8|nr:major facilitator superfamily domain-containing protein [Penicillium waksmanii]KAJ5995608.1 major facilitator superfamily domain-containing protein [Penicillium waksmanii]